jgi:beta-glucanase (GH16 family)
MKKNSNYVIPAAMCSLLLITLFGCEKDTIQKLEQRNWQLVWSDEFNGSAGELPDTTKWVFDIGNGPNNDGWGNAELQYYTDRTANISIDSNGNLAITAKDEVYIGSAFTSARIKTAGLFEQTYGRFEARIKTPWGPGIWPAFWILGSNVDTLGWPQCGEIDIMELRGQKPNIINGTVHGPGYSGAAGITKSFAFENDRYDVDFHLFAVEWGEDYIDFFVDNTLYQEITPDKLTGDWVFDHPFHIILNVAVGGNYVGFPTNQTPFPQTMLVDYVKVYQKADE